MPRYRRHSMMQKGLAGTAQQPLPLLVRVSRVAGRAGTIRAADLQEQPPPCQTPVSRHGSADTLSTAAVSCTFNPPKYRSSTTLAFRGSPLASSSRASFSAISCLSLSWLNFK